MTLLNLLTAENTKLDGQLQTVPATGLPDSMLLRILVVRFLLGSISTGGGGGGSSNAPNSIVTNPASSATSVVVLEANPLRKTVLIINDSTQTLRLVLGATVASSTNVSIILLAGGFTSFTGVDFSGEVRGIWAAANGFARVTETT